MDVTDKNPGNLKENKKKEENNVQLLNKKEKQGGAKAKQKLLKR